MRLQSIPVLALLAGAVTMTTRSLSAQTCFGGLSSVRTMHAVGATAAGTGDRRIMAGSYDLLTDHLMLGAKVGYSGNSFGQSRSGVFDGTIAVSPSGSRARQMQWCPYAQVSQQSLMYGNRTLRTSAGLAIGRDFPVSRNLTLVPFAQSALLHMNANTTLDGPYSRMLGEFGAGVGIRVGDRLAITPSMRAPLGKTVTPLGEPVYSLGFRFGVPR
ncbi:hypothetical protein GAU_3560 [Gemmatimonas aurantiaca T-27]|uniref:Uncharacterized protein n=1 Tax=Gemmatimonas aurantiaca (strain DSM 14586 / JCM 11422 / NBRC 100505 / T-27) TaxID=379066 RepID=C1ADM5_GEMAT|nr:hypothetical protein [Gemmatimonas aurantiaca]BAH40602.1 hypothetical protein GAU_3560 [Gemmatimonas aurantiaca T-27]